MRLNSSISPMRSRSVSSPQSETVHKENILADDVGPVLRRFFTRADDFFVDLFSLTLSNPLLRRQVAERATRATLSIVEPPGFKDVLRLRERDELMHVHTLVAQSAVTRLNEGILHRFAGSNEVERHTAPLGPLFPRS